MTEDTTAAGAVAVSVAPANEGLRGTVNALPKARIFKVHGCRPDINVPITVSPDGGSVISYPAPGDLIPPIAIPLADGFWLDRRGIGPDTRYTVFTIEEYKNIGDKLTPSYLLSHLGDAAWPIVIYELPYPASEENLVARADSLIRLGLPGCPIIYALENGAPRRSR